MLWEDYWGRGRLSEVEDRQILVFLFLGTLGVLRKG